MSCLSGEPNEAHWNACLPARAGPGQTGGHLSWAKAHRTCKDSGTWNLAWKGPSTDPCGLCYTHLRALTSKRWGCLPGSPCSPSTLRQLQRLWQSQFCKKLILLTYLTYWNKTDISCQMQSEALPQLKSLSNPYLKFRMRVTIISLYTHKHTNMANVTLGKSCAPSG